MAILLFLIVIFVLVLVHEFGHFWVAKRTGMRVDEFGIGFPPKLASVKKGETEYSFNLFPIGGFVRIFGENAVDAAASPDRDRSFIAKSPLQQAAVLIAGVTANMLFAWLLFIIVFTMGVPSVVDEAAAGPDARLVIADVVPESPAAEAGIPRGAVVTELAAGDVVLTELTASGFQNFTAENATGPLTISYTAAGQAETVIVTPSQGVVAGSPDRLAVGVSLAMLDTVQEPIHEAVWSATVRTYELFIAVVVGLTTLLAQAFVGEADLASVAGPIGIVGLVDEAAQFGFTSLLLFTALISINLAVINLFPFPALDGGRLVMVAIEVVKGSPIDPVWVARINAAGFFMLIMLMVLVTWSDITKLI